MGFLSGLFSSARSDVDLRLCRYMDTDPSISGAETGFQLEEISTGDRILAALFGDSIIEVIGKSSDMGRNAHRYKVNKQTLQAFLNRHKAEAGLSSSASGPLTDNQLRTGLAAILSKQNPLITAEINNSIISGAGRHPQYEFLMQFRDPENVQVVISSKQILQLSRARLPVPTTAQA